MNDNIVSLRDKLKQLKALHEGGTMDATAHESARVQLERAIVDRVLADGDASRPQLQVLEECRFRFGAHSTDIKSEFSGHYGRKGWWCVYNSRN